MKKILLEKLINKVFPEFSNKVTWTLIASGLGVILLPTPLYVMLINLFIDFYNKKLNGDLDIFKVDSISPSSGTGLTLIISGLIYHLLIKAPQWYVEISKDKANKEINEKKTAVDINLYHNFIKLLPPTSLSIDLLKNHDFGNSYHNNSIKDLENLSYEWGNATHHFHDHVVEEKAGILVQKINNFTNFLAIKSHYLGTGPMLSMLTERDRSAWDWLPQTEENVRKANEDGTHIHELYCDFISTCKKNFII